MLRFTQPLGCKLYYLIKFLWLRIILKIKQKWAWLGVTTLLFHDIWEYSPPWSLQQHHWFLNLNWTLLRELHVTKCHGLCVTLRLATRSFWESKPFRHIICQMQSFYKRSNVLQELRSFFKVYFLGLSILLKKYQNFFWQRMDKSF